MGISFSNFNGSSSSAGTGFNLDVGSSGNTTFTFTEAQPAGAYSITSQLSDSTIEFYGIAADGTSAGTTNTKSFTATKDFIKMVVYGASPNDLITFELKETTQPLSSGQEVSGVAPFLSSATPSTLASIDDTTTVTGGNFAADVEIKFIGQDSSERTPKSVVRSSSTELIVTRPDDFPTTQEPYSMTAINPGFSLSQYAGTLNDYFDAGSILAWVTSAGELSPGYNVGLPYSNTLQATDPDSQPVASYTIVAGSLPAGLSLNSSTGEISGTVNSADNQTFTVRATDSGGEFVDREFTLNELAPATVEYLVIAGGGGGGPSVSGDRSGGGGAGGYRSSVIGETSGRGAPAESTFSANVGVNYLVEIGAGGTGIASAGATNGNDTTFASIVSLGGGHPGGLKDPPAWQGPTNGGSGGGSNEAFTTGGTGATGQGYDGGSNAGGAYNASGGGGGAGGNGGNGNTSQVAGNGGVGVSSSITGSAIGRAGGGGGSGNAASGTASDGGGAGSSSTGGNGTANTGGGGGGGIRDGGSGGSGVVILKYPTSYSITAGPGLTSTTDSSSVPGYRITTFTAGSDNITFVGA